MNCDSKNKSVASPILFVLSYLYISTDDYVYFKGLNLKNISYCEIQKASNYMLQDNLRENKGIIKIKEQVKICG